MDNLSFKEWLKLSELGTSTASVAVVPMPLGGSSGPLRTRKKPKKIALEDFQPLTNLAQRSQDSALNPNGTIPTQNKTVIPAANEFSIQQYKGMNPQVYAKLLSTFRKNNNSTIQNALIKAVNGQDQEMMRLYERNKKLFDNA